jgi:hypothetical protein
MTQRAAPEHAWVRAGPLNTGTLIAEWPQACDCAGGRRPGWRAVTGTLLVADDRVPTRRLETADVIVASAGPGCTGLGEWLRRYPGCAVAAAWTSSGECSVATRDGVLHSVAVSGQHGDRGALACAVFVHGWLAAGLPLALLSPACLRVCPGSAVTWPRAGGPLLFFRFGYCPVSGHDCPVSEDDPGPGTAGPPP